MDGGLYHFRLIVTGQPHLDNLTKHSLISDIAKRFDIMGWFICLSLRPNSITATVGIDWDYPVPLLIRHTWSQWRVELNILSEQHIPPQCYFPKDANVVSLQLHSFSDAIEQACAGTVYVGMVD